MRSAPLSIFVPSAGTVLTDRRGHGEGLIAWNLLSGLARRGHRVTACAREVDLEAEPLFELIETGRASSRESIEPLAYRRAVSRLFGRLGGSDRFQLVHWFRPQGPQAMVWSPPAPTPMVVGPWSPAWPANGHRRRAGDLVRLAASPLFGHMHERALRRASAILISTPAARSGIGPEHQQRTSVLPFGVDTERFSPAPQPHEPTILFVGGLKPEKGALALVQAFAAVRERIPGCRLVLAGEGPDRSLIEQELGRLRLAGEVELLGAQPPAAIPELLKGSSLLCLPSRGEPFGMVVLEAMAAGRPILATDAAGPGHLVDDPAGGRLIPVDYDAQVLAQTLVELLSSRDRLREMGEHNRRRAESDFAWGRILDRLEQVYAEALGGRPA